MSALATSGKSDSGMPPSDQHPSQPLTSRQWLLLGGIVLIASFLRIYGINQESGWASEIIAVYTSKLPLASVPDFLIKDAKNPFDTPFYYWLVHFWFQVVGAGVLQARILAALFGILSVPAIFFLADTLAGRRSAYIASTILALAQFPVWYSQEARSVTQLTFFLLTTCYFFVRALAERRAWLWCAATISSVLMIYTQYYGLFALLILWLYALLYRRRYEIPWTWWASAIGAQAVVIAVWAVVVIQNHPLTRAKLFTPDNASLASKIGWQHLGAVLGWFNNVKWFGFNSTSPPWLLLAGMLLFTVPAIWGCYRLWSGKVTEVEPSRQRQVVFLMGALTLIPIVVAIYLATLGLNKYIEFANDIRYLTFCAAPYYVLVAAGLASIRSDSLRRVAVALVVLFSVISLRAVYFMPTKADYRSPVAYMTEGYQIGDCMLFYPPDREGSLPQGMLLGHLPGPPRFWQVYSPNRMDIRMPKLAELTSGSSGCRRVWFFWDHTSWIGGVKGASEGAMSALEKGYSKAEERRFFQTQVDLFVAK